MTASIQELERRVSALEAAQNDTTETLRWVVAKLGTIAAKQDEHGLRLERIETVQNEHTARLDRIETDLKGLRTDLPTIVGDAMRDVMRDQS